MSLYIYSDESGVFDQQHYNIFVFGGLIIRGKTEKDNLSRKYLAIERRITSTTSICNELKATVLPPNEKRKLFNSMNNVLKFAVVIKQNDILPQIYNNKKTKQRYLDYAYKIGIKKALLHFHRIKAIDINNIHNLHFFCDEHTTATNGRYELREAIEQEFKYGTFNQDYRCHFKPIMPQIKHLTLEYRNSATTTLIRSADIIANRVYYEYKVNAPNLNGNLPNCYITYLP